MRAKAREHLTHARARCASTDRRARETRKQRQARARGARARRASTARARAHFGHARAQISSPKVDLVSLFAIWRAYLRARRAYLRSRVSDGRARVSDGRAREHARASWPCLRTSRARASICSRVSRARLSLLAHLARARVKCSRTRAAHPAAGEAPYMNSYIFLNQANIYIYIYIYTQYYSIYYKNMNFHGCMEIQPTHLKLSGSVGWF